MTNYNDIRYKVKEPIARIVLNRPNALNALSQRLIGELADALERAAQDDQVRVIILAAEGRAWSAGYDLKEEADAEMESDTAYTWRQTLARDVAITMKVWEIPKPVIAAVQGYCLAGGCELAMACDITIAAENAIFGEPEVRFGSGPVTLLMPWLIGVKRTKELLYTGDMIDAHEAERIGMINRVVPLDDLAREAEALALKMARVPPEVMALTKRPINRTFEIMGLYAALQANVDISSILNTVNSPEQLEFYRIVREEGLKEALAWRESRY
jgi:enoyl-CoA hydratase